MCEHFGVIQRGGRPRKTKNTPGRPAGISPRYCASWVRKVAPASLVPSDQTITVCQEHLHLPIKELTCPMCGDIFREPVELVTCGSIMCAKCLCDWLHNSNTFTCPQCHTDHLKDFQTHPASSFTGGHITGQSLHCLWKVW